MNRRSPFDDVWVADKTPGHHYLDLANISEVSNGPPISVLSASEIDPRIDLMLTSRVGAISPSLRTALGIRVAFIDWSARSSDLGDVLDICWERDRMKLARLRRFVRLIGDGTEAPVPPDFLARTPFSVTEEGSA
jgi:hypothetical protein